MGQDGLDSARAGLDGLVVRAMAVELDASEWFARIAADHAGDVEFERTPTASVGVRGTCACGWRGVELRITPSRARLDHVAHVVTIASVARARLESEADS